MANNYLSLLLSVLANESALQPLYDAASLSCFPSDDGMAPYFTSKFYTTKELCELTSEDDESFILSTDGEKEIDEKLLERLKKVGSFELPLSDSPSKVTVSQLKIGLIDEEKKVITQREKPVPKPRFVMENAEYTAADRGTATHLFMQFADYKACETDCEKEADRLCERGFIEKYQRGLLELDNVKKFFATDFYKTISQSKKIYREQRFNLSVSAFDEDLDGGTLVQGVIDLFFENADGTYTVVDFKTDRVFGKDAERTLIDRHRQQLLYYKKAVEQMTQREVSKAVIYSFCLMKDISVE